jgi:DNA-binding transcriptional regulator of glucitol operon
MIKSLQEKAGFISIEGVIVWGLMIALGAWAWHRFYGASEVVIDNAIQINATAMDVHVTE